MNYFDILLQMKTGKKVPYSKSYFDTLFAAKLAEMQIKTLTGTLPLVFRTSETALRSWTIYGNNTPHIAQQTSVLPLTFATVEDELRDWEIRGNDESYNLWNGTIEQGTTGGGQPQSASNRVRSNTFSILPGEYTFTFNNFENYQFAYDMRDKNKAYIGGTGWLKSNTFTLGNDVRYLLIKIKRNDNGDLTPQEINDIMLVKGSTPPSTYIPYQQGVGQLVNDHYEIPLSVNGSTVNLTIGNAPLTAGQSISKTSTGVDIATAVGENTISTTLYNKPETAIEYCEYVGVGEKSGNNWQIPLTISDGTNTTSVNVPIDAPLTEGESVTDTQTISTFTGENTIDTTMTNKPEMTITYKGG